MKRLSIGGQKNTSKKLWKDSKDIEFVKQTIGHRKLDTTSVYVNKLSDQERQKRIDQLE